ncbi:MAG: hypothetical protein DRN71_03500 [Candidatus Nanohalarchaeota archaeon]|nr:MAG: hypothetical protein DRN71_03500 [Candidatus Nanohaloarchaeota archaeon]
MEEMKLDVTEHIEQALKTLENSGELTFVGADKSALSINNMFDKTTLQQVYFALSPPTGMYTEKELNDFMNQIVESIGIEPENKHIFRVYGDTLIYGNSKYMEEIGEIVPDGEGYTAMLLDEKLFGQDGFDEAGKMPITKPTSGSLYRESELYFYPDRNVAKNEFGRPDYERSTGITLSDLGTARKVDGFKRAFTRR